MSTLEEVTVQHSTSDFTFNFHSSYSEISKAACHKKKSSVLKGLNVSKGHLNPK